MKTQTFKVTITSADDYAERIKPETIKRQISWGFAFATVDVEEVKDVS